jgi:hypothetical protein
MEIQVPLNIDKNNGYFICSQTQIFDLNLLISSENEKYFRQIYRENKTPILCSKNFFENRAVHVIMWKNNAQPGRQQMTI